VPLPEITILNVLLTSGFVGSGGHFGLLTSILHGLGDLAYRCRLT
jgi:hypothetical protein